MPRQLFIDDHIEMRGDALHRSNMDGPWQETKVHLHDHFTGIALDTTNVWAVANQGTSDTTAINAAVGGHVRQTLGTGDDDSMMIASELIFEGDKQCVCEARIRINDVSGTGLFFGFSDAKSETNTNIAIHYASDTQTAVATNACGFVVDADHATSSIMCNGVKAGTLGTAVDSGTDWADAVWHVLRVEVDVDGNAVYLLDGAVVGRVANAVTDSTDLCVTVQSIVRAAEGADTIDIDRIDAWQDE